jgi:hypothetical protein
MKLNSCSIFSESSSSRSDKKSLGGDQTSILRDLDPGAARFSGRSVVKGQNVFWAAILLLLGGGLAWLVLSTQNGAESHGASSEVRDARSGVAGMPLTVANVRTQENTDGGENAGKPTVPVASEAVSAPAIIHGALLSSSTRDGLPEGKPNAGVGDGMSNRNEKDIRPEPLVSTAPSLARTQDVAETKERREKKNDPHSRNSQPVVVKPESGKNTSPVANRSSQNDKHATERDVEIITVLVK